MGLSSLYSSRFLIHLCLCLLLASAVLSQATAQDDNIDSLQIDSLQKVLEAEEIAALIPSNYAGLIIQVNDKFDPEISEAQNVVFDTEIERLEAQYEELDRLTSYVLARANVIEGIRTLEAKWNDQLDDVTDYADQLESRTNAVIDLKKELTEARTYWVETRSALEYGEHPPQILRYVAVSIDTIDHYFEASAEIIDTFTVMYTDVVELMLQSREVATRLKGMRQSRLSRLMRSQGDYIWNAKLFAGNANFREHWSYLRNTGVGDVKYYVQEHAVAIRQMIVWFILFVAMFFWARSRSLKLDDEEEPELVRNVHVLNQPFVMSVFTSIILATLVLPNLPPLLGYVFAFIAVICVVSILTMMMRGGIKWLGYTLAALYVALEVSDFLSVGEAEARWLTLAISVGTLITTIWIWQRRGSIRSESMNQSWSRLMIVLSIPMAVVAILAIVANVLGYGSIAAFLNHGAVLVLIIGLLLLSVFKSLMSVVYHGFHTTFAHNSVIIKEDGDALFRGLTNILRLVTLGIYVYYCLSFFLLWEPVYDILQSVWSFGYAFGSVMLTVGDVVNVILIIIAFWIVASILRILLRKEVFNRVHAPRGVGNAVASMTHYTIMVVGVFLALASAGFETRHLGILAGALGVGIGFGLQTIVNNFLSGLILVFERPVTVDDVVEVDGILGTVTAIGIRSSKIRQFNGDEVIVPNADLISKRVTNRTLSDTMRRYTMTFETGRADDPEKVIEIITAAAQGVDGVLDEPPVKAYFQGMGAQSIKFYVNYWGSGSFLDLMSDVEMTVYKALQESQIQMPIPVQIEIQKDD